METVELVQGSGRVTLVPVCVDHLDDASLTGILPQMKQRSLPAKAHGFVIFAMTQTMSNDGKDAICECTKHLQAVHGRIVCIAYTTMDKDEYRRLVKGVAPSFCVWLRRVLNIWLFALNFVILLVLLFKD